MQKTNRKPGIHLHTSISNYIKEYYWILIAKNGKTIAKSSETYKTKRAAVRSMVVAADVLTGHKPKSYYDHTGKKGVEVVEF